MALLVVAGVLATTGCDNPFRPRIGYLPVATEPPPKPTSPQGLMRLFRWCWVNREIADYEDLFTEDFRFVFTDVEAVDNPPILRDEELQIARRIFQDGSVNEPRARRIEFLFVNEPLIPIADTRPGKTDPWHKLIQTRVTLRVELSDPTPITIDGDLNFFVVRGDSALIPPEMQERGFGPDPKRWYIERWEDRTQTPGQTSVAAVLAMAVQQGVPITMATDRSRASAPAVASAAAGGPPIWTWGDLMLLFK